jgi:hypothetical protein
VIWRKAKKEAFGNSCFRKQMRRLAGGPIPECNYSPTQVLNKPASSVFIRNTEIAAADYSKFSIREIAPE